MVFLRGVLQGFKRFVELVDEASMAEPRGIQPSTVQVLFYTASKLSKIRASGASLNPSTVRFANVQSSERARHTKQQLSVGRLSNGGYTGIQ